MKSIALITSILVGTLLALPATAQSGPGMGGGMGPGMGRESGMMEGGMGGRHGGKRFDCAEAKDPKACAIRREAHKAGHDKAREQCKDKTGAERRQCMHDMRMAAEDCTTARNPDQCNARKKAYEACKDKTGEDKMACLREQRPTAKGAEKKQ